MIYNVGVIGSANGAYVRGHGVLVERYRVGRYVQPMQASRYFWFFRIIHIGPYHLGSKDYFPFGFYLWVIAF